MRKSGLNRYLKVLGYGNLRRRPTPDNKFGHLWYVSNKPVKGIPVGTTGPMSTDMPQYRAFDRVLLSFPTVDGWEINVETKDIATVTGNGWRLTFVLDDYKSYVGRDMDDQYKSHFLSVAFEKL